MKLESGFVKADSRNLPNIDIFMVFNYIRNDERFNDPEVRNAKTNLSSRQNYGDSAIGYVSLRRDGNICILKGKVCPEHKVRNSPYSVTLIVNEDARIVNTVECEGCTASIGGCKHAIAFLMWVHRRSEEPSPTEVTCYWKKSALAAVAGPKQYVRALNLIGSNEHYSSKCTQEYELKQTTFFQTVVQIAKQKQLDSQLSRHWFDLEERQHITLLSLHQLMICFLDCNSMSAKEFLEFAENKITDTLCCKVEQLTRSQSDNKLWFELRYGRITASKIYEAAHCSTSDGSLVNEIIGASKVFETNYMKRGKSLEKLILNEVKKTTGIKYTNCGLFLEPSCPIMGASPDAIGEDFIIEIKAPATEEGFKKFLPNGLISNKCKAQMYLQMFCTKKNKGLFCVANPNFEQTKKVTTVWLSYDKNFSSVIDQATTFWINNIFPRLLASVK